MIKNGVNLINSHFKSTRVLEMFGHQSEQEVRKWICEKLVKT